MLNQLTFLDCCGKFQMSDTSHEIDYFDFVA